MDSTLDVIKSTNNQNLIFDFKYIIIFSIAFSTTFISITFLTMVYCCIKRRNSSYKSTSTTTTTSSTNDLTNPKLQEICIIPVTKPTFNESKPQLNIDLQQQQIQQQQQQPLPVPILLQQQQQNIIASHKPPKIIPSPISTQQQKTLIERRGSNNSLTLTLDPIKRKLSIGSPPIECPANNEYTYKSSNLLTLNELIKVSKDHRLLYNEFNQIPTNHQENINVLGSGIKNRYKTIIPNESTRVKLPIRNNDPLTSYINANYLNGYCEESKAYIATQGPMSNTINDFWCMIWNDRIRCIVMITKLYENHKQKCELYLPENCDQSVTYGDYTVTVNSITYKADYEIRQLSISCNNECRILYHYWYTTWPDHNVPDNPSALIDLIKQVDICRTSFNDYKLSPVLVHCSAGIGRTGCYIAIASGINQIDLDKMIDVMQIVTQMRQERGGMIQTVEQYEFVYQVLAYYCIYYKKIYSDSPTSPSSCLQSFTFNAQTIQ